MNNKEEVIEGLKKVWNAFNHMEHELYADYVFDALVMLKEQDTNEWVSVKDRLPEQGKNVLVYIERNAYYRNGEIARKREIAIGRHIEGRWHVDECIDVVGICWQELPEPPKEVSG